MDYYRFKYFEEIANKLEENILEMFKKIDEEYDERYERLLKKIALINNVRFEYIKESEDDVSSLVMMTLAIIEATVLCDFNRRYGKII